ncbi:FMN-binding protein [Mariniplasma anaerobium]|uniref:FMN-binding domain-containing protein n=1 Tax=Mariniplasma anaerobium TaxID=2735436 RepID=A0A7U9TIM1_9MOLU|nr:FMN-binding protein [Mariniplasma anaerobium]BCR35918.1 hypothetical protein MPAN_008110 [Mariniplasma anaerobium]
MIIILIIILALIAYVYPKIITKTFVPTTILFTLISATAFFVDFSLLSPFKTGFLGLAFFIIVMFAGAMPKHSVLEKKFKSVRKEYSIYGFITITPHAILFFIDMLNETMNFEWFGVMTYLIMVPLFITSFYIIRKKMSNKTWKILQKASYIIYLLLYIHLILFYTGNNIYLYTALFVFYVALKNYNHFSFSKTVIRKLIISSVAVVLILSIAYIGTDGQIIASHAVNKLYMSDLSIEDGVYYGSADGYEDYTVVVEVIIEQGVIKSIILLDDGSSEPRKEYDYTEIAKDVIEEIIEKQHTDIDVVSGATHTVDGVVNAVLDALLEH